MVLVGAVVMGTGCYLLSSSKSLNLTGAQLQNQQHQAVINPFLLPATQQLPLFSVNPVNGVQVSELPMPLLLFLSVDIATGGSGGAGFGDETPEVADYTNDF